MRRLIDEQYIRTPFYGSPRMTAWLRTQGYGVNHKRVARRMQTMGLQAIYPKARGRRAKASGTYPYLLRQVKIERVNQVWSTDITYSRLPQGWLYLVVILDWFRRYVITWQVALSLDSDFCLVALERALGGAQPEIFNSDQGVQFTSHAFTQRLSGAGIAMSQAGRGRCFDNIFVERLWRTVKYEEVYLKDYRNATVARSSLSQYFAFYNQQRLHQAWAIRLRLHQALGYQTPAAVYFGS